MKKITDNEIIKAVKSCKSIEDELSLIDRLKGERDCYKNELKYANIEKEALNKLCGEQKAEIEKLSNCVVMQEKLLKENEKWMESVVKNIISDKKLEVETINEFEHKLFSYLGVGHLRPRTEKCFSEIEVKRMIERVGKEMVGE